MGALLAAHDVPPKTFPSPGLALPPVFPLCSSTALTGQSPAEESLGYTLLPDFPVTVRRCRPVETHRQFYLGRVRKLRQKNGDR